MSDIAEVEYDASVDTSGMRLVADTAITVALDALLDYAKYLSDHGQLSYELLKQRVDSYKENNDGK